MIEDRCDLHLPFLVFNQLLYLDKNGLFWAEISVHKSAFFSSKTPSLNCLIMHHNEVLRSILMWEKFGPVHPSKILDT